MKSEYVCECWTFLYCLLSIIILCKGDDQIKKSKTISDLWEILLKQASLLNFPTYNETEYFFQESMKLYPHLITRFPIGVSYENRTLFGYRIHNMTKKSRCILKQSSLSDSKETIFDIKLKKCQVPLFSKSKSFSMVSLIDRLQNTRTIQTNYRRECPRILLTALHHAREPLSLTTLLYFIQKLIYTAEHEKTGNDLSRYLLEYRDIVLIPFVNPDGYIAIEKSRYFLKRKNARPTCPMTPKFSGVDLNRNYGYRFKKNGNMYVMT
jgi:murein tripeptide amidase MpaA